MTLTPGGTAVVTEVITASGVPPGVYPITNVAVGGNIIHTATVNVNVIKTSPPCSPGLTITASPGQLILNHTNMATGKVFKTISSTCGFTGSGVLNFTSTPPGLTITLSSPTFSVTPQHQP